MKRAVDAKRADAWPALTRITESAFGQSIEMAPLGQESTQIPHSVQSSGRFSSATLPRS